MATTSKTWAWSTLESWAFTDATGYWTGSLDTSNGNPANSLKAVFAAKNKVSAGYWSIQDTWANIFGIAAGATVNQVRIYGLDTRCYGFTDMDEVRYSDQTASNVNGLWTDCLVSGNQLWAGRQVTGVEGSWTSTGAGTLQDVAGGYQAGDATVEFRLYTYADSQNSGSATATLNHDNLVIEIDYTAAVANKPRPTCIYG